MTTLLHASFHRHLDALITGPENHVSDVLAKCLSEAQLDWHGTDHRDRFLSGLRNFRSRYPKGISQRTSKRRALVDVLVAEFRATMNGSEAAEREWWNALPIQSITAVVERLTTIPPQYHDIALDSLLALPTPCPLMLNDEIHRLIWSRKHLLLAREDRIRGPFVIALVGYLVANKEDLAARELLDKFPNNDESSLGSLVSYLRYVLSTPLDLGGATVYSTLTPEDLFLGACYYEGPSLPALQRQSKWDYESLEINLSNSKPQGAVNDFKVRGLQPRIAELAFRHVYGQLHGASTRDMMRDLNVECVRNLTLPWGLDRKPRLPPADWDDLDGKTYDVKCNLFYRSHQDKTGLRGFMINLPRIHSEHHYYPGIVFTNTDDESCSWVYIGEYQPKTTERQREDRVLPFFFRLPDRVRHIPFTKTCDPRVGIELLKDSSLRIGWQLATGMIAPQQSPTKRTETESLLDAFVERCIKETADTFLEYALWKILTETTLDACCHYDRKTVCEYLKRVEVLISSRCLPVHLPLINDKPILCHWIKEVLNPIATYWNRIASANCRCGKTEPRAIQLQITRMTSGGTIEGRISCTRCNNSKNKATILTHCHECNRYPLIIGKNPVCTDCGGLFCDWLNKENNRCKSCKMDCGKAKLTDRYDHEFINSESRRRSRILRFTPLPQSSPSSSE